MKTSITILKKQLSQAKDKASKIVALARKEASSFTRKSPLGVFELLLYILNRRGITNKMELFNFLYEAGLPKVSDSALLQQRQKLNEDIFKHMAAENLQHFYSEVPQSRKTFKGYILSAIDGSRWEVPNTKEMREYSKMPEGKVPRLLVSMCFDLLNACVLDVVIDNYRASERKLARMHSKPVKEIVSNFPIIHVLDRGYISHTAIYHNVMNDENFVYRVPKKYYSSTIRSMTSDDEWRTIPVASATKSEIKKSEPEHYHALLNGFETFVRIVKVRLSTGEEEVLITNLPSEKFSIEDLTEIYRLRWGIETNYDYLKNSMKATNLSSGKLSLIKQDIYSQVLMFNVLQSVQEEIEQEIDQTKYKHKMKVNINMAVGQFKRMFIQLMLSENSKKYEELTDMLFDYISSELVPIRPGRKYPRKKTKWNKHPFSTRTSF
jgi:hypothetical protein